MRQYISVLLLSFPLMSCGDKSQSHDEQPDLSLSNAQLLRELSESPLLFQIKLNESEAKDVEPFIINPERFSDEVESRVTPLMRDVEEAAREYFMAASKVEKKGYTTSTFPGDSEELHPTQEAFFLALLTFEKKQRDLQRLENLLLNEKYKSLDDKKLKALSFWQKLVLLQNMKQIRPGSMKDSLARIPDKIFEEQPEEFKGKFTSPDRILDQLELKNLYDWYIREGYNTDYPYGRPVPSERLKDLIREVHGWVDGSPGVLYKNINSIRGIFQETTQKYILSDIEYTGRSNFEFSSARLSSAGYVICKSFLDKLEQKNIVPHYFSKEDVQESIKFKFDEFAAFEHGENDLKIFMANFVYGLSHTIWESTVGEMGEYILDVVLPDAGFYRNGQPMTMDMKQGMTSKEIESFAYMLIDVLKDDAFFKQFFSDFPTALALSGGMIGDVSLGVSFRDARTASTGRVDGSRLSVSGVTGESIALDLPLFVQVKGDITRAKTTEAATGSVAYRLGNTVIGAIQGYANSGIGFGGEGRQVETSVMVSQSVGRVFLEGQVGFVTATQAHNSEWTGYRSEVTLGFDTACVSPFIQVSHRQLDRDGTHTLHETEGYVGLEMDLGHITGDTYAFNTHLLTKVGVGTQQWDEGTRDMGSTQGMKASVEWNAGLRVNSGVSFNTHVNVDTRTGSSAGLKISLDR